jgi:FkbM family methyltransferase
MKNALLCLVALLHVAAGLVIRQEVANSTSTGQAPWLFFDFGFFDGRDSLSYLSQGYRVIAVEADPTLAAAGKANPALAPYIAAGKLQILNYAIALDGAAVGQTTFYLNKCSKEWNSFQSSVGCRSCVAPNLEDPTKASCTAMTVTSTPCSKVFQDHGLPVYLKADMEGAEQSCYNALKAYPVAQRPNLISGEVTDAQLIDTFAALGYTSFKVVRQQSGHSGGWGDLAQDCRTAGLWRSQASANAELTKIYDKVNPNPPTDGCPSMVSGTGVWYDIHASRIPPQA